MADAADELEAQPARPATRERAGRAAGKLDAQPALAVGDLLGLTYELVERLGAGGMGVVFRARDHRLGRDVAVKLVRPAAGGGEDDEHLRRLFEREARATAQLLHPNIVTLHHVGEHDGKPYLVLELMSGETLSARLARRGRLAVPEALAIVDAVLAALAFAHARGVLHRDLKPNNVFVTGDERIKVLDFGLALSLDSAPGPVTRSAGTPGYMAPEQRDGGSQDARTDVWAAALLLVECLSGRRPDERDASAAVDELDAPARVRDVLRRALAASPAQRPKSAGELKLALLVASGREQARPIPRRRWISALAVTAVVAAALGAGAMRCGSSGPTRPTPSELSGAWLTGMFGTMLLHVEDDGTTYGIYQWDDGVIVGTYKDGVLDGRWCEVPTRRGPDDGGRLRISFVRGANRLMADGLWSYGDSPAATWNTDWTGSKLDSPPPPDLEQRLERRMTCP